MKNNPYKPPKVNSTREVDRYLETIDNRDQTDWGSFLFIVVIFFIFFFHNLLVDFFIGIFRKLLVGTFLI